MAETELRDLREERGEAVLLPGKGHAEHSPAPSRWLHDAGFCCAVLLAALAFPASVTYVVRSASTSSAVSTAGGPPQSAADVFMRAWVSRDWIQCPAVDVLAERPLDAATVSH